MSAKPSIKDWNRAAEILREIDRKMQAGKKKGKK